MCELPAKGFVRIEIDPPPHIHDWLFMKPKYNGSPGELLIVGSIYRCSKCNETKEVY